MLAISRDEAWLSRLESLAAEGGWAFEVRASIPAPARTPPPERALVVCDETLLGKGGIKVVELLRALYPSAVLVVACVAHGEGLTAAISSGADEVVDKSLDVGRLRSCLAVLRDRALTAALRVSADGGLRVDKRSRRAFVRLGKDWRDLGLASPDFELLWLLLAREGAPVSREAALTELGALFGREPSLETLSRRVRSLKLALSSWGGTIESRQSGVRLVSGPKPVSRGAGPRRKRTRSSTSRPS